MGNLPATPRCVTELGEELGFHDQIGVLGRLSDSYVFASDYCITPWLAYTSVEVEWRPHPDEVQSVLEVYRSNRCWKTTCNPDSSRSNARPTRFSRSMHSCRRSEDLGRD